MAALLAVLVFGALFAGFAMLGPAERSEPCLGPDGPEGACGDCPVLGDGGACPLGAKGVDRANAPAPVQPMSRKEITAVVNSPPTAVSRCAGEGHRTPGIGPARRAHDCIRLRPP